MKVLIIALLCIICIIWQTDAKPKLNKQKLKIVTIESAPFLFVEEDEGNQVQRGYLMDLLEELKTKLGFESEVYLVPDGKYGYKDESGNWHGIIGELVNGKADIALAPLTVSKERETVVKFSVPYMSAGLVPITKRPKQGKRLPFMDVMDMVQNPDLTYGCVGQGSTYQFFQSSTHALYKAMGIVLKDNPDQMAESYELGIEKVRSDNGYVFFGEEPSMKFYEGGEPCDLLIIGKQLHERFYALAFPQEKQEMASLFNIALLELNERGTKDRLMDKWWEDDCKKPDYCICQKSVSSEEESHENSTHTEDVKIRVRRHDHQASSQESHDNSTESKEHEEKKRVRRHDHEGHSQASSQESHDNSAESKDDEDKKRVRRHDHEGHSHASSQESHDNSTESKEDEEKKRVRRHDHEGHSHASSHESHENSTDAEAPEPEHSPESKDDDEKIRVRRHGRKGHCQNDHRSDSSDQDDDTKRVKRHQGDHDETSESPENGEDEQSDSRK